MNTFRSILIVVLLLPSLSSAQAIPKPPTLCLDDGPCVEPTAGKTKWNPGHYMDTDTVERLGADDPKNVSVATLRSIADTPFKGALVRYGWGVLEPAKNQYDFSRIRAHRDVLAAIGKRLIIEVKDSTYTSDNGPPPSYILPSYLQTDPLYEGGYAPRGDNQGTAPKFWLAPVMDRQIALFAALGREFDQDPWVEIVSFGETALFNVPPPGYSKSAQAMQFRRLADGLNAAFPNTTVCILSNFFHTLGDLRDLMDYFIEKRVCVGGPDVRPDNRVDSSEILSGQFDGVDRRAKAAIFFHNEWRSLGGDWTLDQLQNYAHNVNKQHYTSWARRESSTGLSFSRHILPWIKTNPPPTRTTCPTSYVNGCAGP